MRAAVGLAFFGQRARAAIRSLGHGAKALSSAHLQQTQFTLREHTRWITSRFEIHHLKDDLQETSLQLAHLLDLLLENLMLPTSCPTLNTNNPAIQATSCASCFTNSPGTGIFRRTFAKRTATPSLICLTSTRSTSSGGVASSTRKASVGSCHSPSGNFHIWKKNEDKLQFLVKFPRLSHPWYLSWSQPISKASSFSQHKWALPGSEHGMKPTSAGWPTDWMQSITQGFVGASRLSFASHGTFCWVSTSTILTPFCVAHATKGPRHRTQLMGPSPKCSVACFASWQSWQSKIRQGSHRHLWIWFWSESIMENVTCSHALREFIVDLFLLLYMRWPFCDALHMITAIQKRSGYGNMSQQSVECRLEVLLIMNYQLSWTSGVKRSNNIISTILTSITSINSINIYIYQLMQWSNAHFPQSAGRTKAPRRLRTRRPSWGTERMELRFGEIYPEWFVWYLSKFMIYIRVCAICNFCI